MKTIIRIICRRFTFEKGGTLPLVLVFLMLGSLIIPPLLSYMGTGIITTRMYEQRTDTLYAADSGIEDAKYLIKNDHLEDKFEDSSPPYEPYDYDTEWSYWLDENINQNPVNVTIKNVFTPKGFTPPSPEIAEQLIVGDGENLPKIILTSAVTQAFVDHTNPGKVEIKIQYYPDTDDDLKINELGIWLPCGFTYRTDLVSNIDGYDNNQAPEITDYHGGQAIVWKFDNWPFLGDEAQCMNAFPADSRGHFVDPDGVLPLVSKISFSFDASETGNTPWPVAWINTNTDLTPDGTGGVYFTWDGDFRVFHVISETEKATIDTYLEKDELRMMRGALTGEYVAAGNTLMRNARFDSYYIRDTWLNVDHSSSATINSIPSEADVAAAYLYWTAWKDFAFYEACNNFDLWSQPFHSDWRSMNNPAYFQAHHTTGMYNGIPWVGDRYLPSKTINLSSYVGQTVKLSWEQKTSGVLEITDGLDFFYTADGGLNWTAGMPVLRGQVPNWTTFSLTIPAAYLTPSFKIKFYLQGCDQSDEYCYIDNITIHNGPDTSVYFNIDGQRAYFDADGNPCTGGTTGLIVADRSEVLINEIGEERIGFSYSSFKDVTRLVKAYAQKAPDPAENVPGDGTYTVGGVDGTVGVDTPAGNTKGQLAHAGWSLIIIYTSPDTKGHQLYLFDRFTFADDYTDLDFDRDGNPGGDISGFIVPSRIQNPDGSWEEDAAKITCFVGEGDDFIKNEFIALNAPEQYWDETPDYIHIPYSNKLSDGVDTTKNNPWNGKSTVFTADGIDVDTFVIKWSSGLLSQGDTSAHIDIYTDQDNWNLVYIILSFRSATSCGGTLSYLIH